MWSLLWTSLRLARRELRGGLKGFRVFLLCLALGVGAIAAVGMLTEALVAGLRADGGNLLGGDIELRVSHQPWTAEQRAFVERNAEISRVIEFRTMARTAGGGRALVELKGVDGAYPLVGAMRLESGMTLAQALARRDGVWGAVVEQTVLRKLGLEVGDTIALGQVEAVIRDTIAREPDRGADGFMLGPRVMVARPVMAQTGLIRVGSLIRYRYRLKLADDADLIGFRETLAERFPKASWRVRDVRNGAPGLKRFVDRMRLFLTLVGLTSLLVGGLGIANAVKAYLDGKSATIATMKCLGAPAGLVFGTYFWQILALAGLGTLLGLGIGALVPILLSGLISEYLPFQARIGLYWGPMVLAAVYGLLTALTFALWPLAQARETPAGMLFRNSLLPSATRPRWRYILATAGLAMTLAVITVATAEIKFFAVNFLIATAVTFLLFLAAGDGLKALIRRLPRARRPGLRLALANVVRPGAATVSIILSFGIGLSVLVTVMVLRANIEFQISERLPDQAPAYYFIGILPDQAERFEQVALAVPSVRDILKVPTMRGRITKVAGVPVDEIEANPRVAWVHRGDRTMTYARTLPKGTTLVEGEWWAEDYSGPLLLSISVEAARGLGLEIGDTMTINILGREMTAKVANLRRINWTTLGMNFVLVFSPGLLSSAPHTFLATAKADEDQELALEAAVTDTFRNVTAIRVRDALEAANRILGNISIAVRATAAVTLLAGVLVLAGALVAGHRRRVYDSVVLKVLGARRREIMAAYLLEYALLGLITALLAAVVGGAAA